METDRLSEAALPDVPAGRLARGPAVQTDALDHIQDGETLYGLCSGAVPEQQANVPRPDSFPPNLFKYVGHGGRRI